MKNVRQPIWWIPLARRVVGWGATISAMAGMLPLLVVAIILSVVDFGPIQFDADYVAPSLIEKLLTSALIATAVASPFLIGGFALGATAGFYAPATEPTKPLKSRFFRGVASQTLGFWSYVYPTLSLTFYFGFPYFGLEVPMVAVLTLCVVVFALSLWRALNRALRATKTKRS